MSVTSHQARQLVEGALLHARERRLKPLAVVVLDAGGHVVRFEREDGASAKRFEIARGKAYGAIAMGMGSRALMERAEQQPYFIASVGASIDGPMVPVPGGVLVLSADGALLGAVGVTGDTSDNDEAAAIAGIHSCGLIAVPGLPGTDQGS